MIARTIAIIIAILCMTVLGTAVAGRLWRFVRVRPQDPRSPRPLTQRLLISAPTRWDYADAQERIGRLDLPLAVLFILGSLLILGTRGIGGAWFLTFVLWCGGAILRWLMLSIFVVQIRCAMVILLVIESLLVLGIRGGSALPQALVYLAAALAGALFLYRANELPFAPGPAGPESPYRRLTRAMDAPVPQYETGMHLDTMPSIAPRRPLAEVTPISYARRGPLRRRSEDAGAAAPPHYASGR
jgi:hypothetical protein